jgi:hypothetical protein
MLWKDPDCRAKLYFHQSRNTLERLRNRDLFRKPVFLLKNQLTEVKQLQL